MKLAENARLFKAVADIAPGNKNPWCELVLVFGVRSHRGDMQTRMQIFCVYQRDSAWCGRDGDVGERKRFMHTCGYLTADALHALREAPRTFRVTCPDGNVVDLADQPYRLQLQACLLTRPNHGHTPRVLACEPARGDRARRSGANRGEITVVEQHGLSQSGTCRKHQHEAIETRQTEGRIVEKAGTDLDGKAIETRQPRSLYIDFTGMLGKIETKDWRHGHGFRRERKKC